MICSLLQSSFPLRQKEFRARHIAPAVNIQFKVTDSGRHGSTTRTCAAQRSLRMNRQGWKKPKFQFGWVFSFIFFRLFYGFFSLF
jgi:hypothetical protein